jgi:hypothetical protein
MIRTMVGDYGTVIRDINVVVRGINTLFSIGMEANISTMVG